MTSRRSILLALVLVALAATSCSKRFGAKAGTPVIIISIDTLRSDRLPAYGYRGVETPNLDRFREDAILYEKAYSHCPLTLPSHATMLTGLLPADTGIRDNVGYQLRERIDTLPALLKKQGYATGAAVSAFVLRKESGLNRGFDFYDDQVESVGTGRVKVIGRMQRSGTDTVSVAREWIDQQKEKPFFFMLHVYEPHTPYTPPEPYKSRYASSYDGEIAHVDEIIGRFLEDLKERGLYDKSLIIITSDHGEGLNDHEEEEHGIFLYREAIQVPLLVKLAGSNEKGATVSTPVQLADIFPTVLEHTATPQVQLRSPAKSLTSFIKQPAPKRQIYSESYYAKFHFGWSDLHSLTDGEHHYIRAPKPELYDLTKDPSEKQNIYAENRRVYTAMRREIEPFVKEAAAPQAVSAEEAAKLAALGYLGSTVKADEENLPDPKDKIDAFTEVRMAFGLYRKREYQRVLQVVDALLAENRLMLDLWDLRSKALHGLGRTEEAITAAQEGLKISPNAGHLAISIANYQIELKRLDEAQKHAELVLKSEPGQAHEILARIHVARGDFTSAEREARLALEHRNDRIPALMTLARIERDRKNYGAAIAHLDEAAKAAEKNSTVSNLHLLRGDVMARMGRFAEAEAAFKMEISLFPEEPQPYKNLILLYVDQGRLEEAKELIFELVRKSPTPPAYLAVIQTLHAIGDDRGVRYWARRGLQQFPNHPQLRTYAG